ncbi:BamA/TamA family outer membrane protein [Massilia sp. CCM 8733]|uniref:Translocation and assembly module subunit TamA n=1 Tax=Massilia mucilaginosa TaxID=2609282 RepID=A0ABX0NNQ2_9BURK|nr:BamA/TamA family outer membrane protein [Massilia mucilaginosa]
MFPATPDKITARTPRQRRILAQIAVTVCLAAPPALALAQESEAGAAQAAQQAPARGIDYSVRVDAPGPLDDLLEENLDLVRWQGNPRLDLDQLQRLVKAAPEQAKTLIATEGYYSPKVSAGLDTSGAKPVARITVDPGEPVVVGDVELVLKGFEPVGADAKAYDANDLRQRWGLPVGQRFRQADWEGAKRNLLRQVMMARYPRAQLVESSAIVDPDVRRALLKVVLDSGPEARFGELRVEGLKRYSRTIVSNLNRIRPGQEYSEAALQAYQARLQDTGYFSTVEVSADMAAALSEDIDAMTDDQKNIPRPPVANPAILPVLVRVTENKQKNVDVGLGYSTNTGARAQLNYDDLDVFGLRMKSNLIMEQKRQTARADFYFPTTIKGYNDSFGAGFERNDLRGEVTNVATVAGRRAWGTPLLERSLTLEYLSERRLVEGVETRRSNSVPLTFSWTKRALDNLVLPTRGYVLNAQFGGAVLPLLTDERFLRASTRFVNYRPLGPSSNLIVRAEAGVLASRDKAGVPSTFLFRAGGDQSVRGYGYQELGVREGDAIVGGRYLLTGSVEYQYWFKPPWGVAFFYDAGNAADKFKDLKPESGYGLGARWRSPVGPINVDLAYGQALKKARLHFSLGFTF